MWHVIFRKGQFVREDKHSTILMILYNLKRTRERYDRTKNGHPHRLRDLRFDAEGITCVSIIRVNISDVSEIMYAKSRGRRLFKVNRAIIKGGSSRGDRSSCPMSSWGKMVPKEKSRDLPPVRNLVSPQVYADLRAHSLLAG